jgi:cAMP-binding proteins - catabolite gene activator and regulatory subunit of cAMP-dependent protein kinases
MNTTSYISHPGVEQWLSHNTLSESPFIALARNMYPISAEARDYINQRTFLYRIRKNELLVATGNMCPNIYLIRKGVLRSFVKEGIKEITTWIAGEHELVTSITSLGLQQPARENIQAIEDCELFGLSNDDLEYLYDHFPEMNLVGRKLLEKYYRDAEERAFIARLTEATAKYKHFVVTKNELLTRVPLKYIASYLGVTLETLSRIRSKLSRTSSVEI